MNVEQPQPPIDGTPPEKKALSQVLDKLYEQMTGDGNPDEHFKSEVPPTSEQLAHRNLYVRLNQKDTLS